MKSVLRPFLPILLLLTFGCANDSESDLLDLPVENIDDTNDEDQEQDVTVTFSANIQPIIVANCLGCHSSPPRNGAPFPLVTFDQVSSRNAGVLRTVSLQTGQPGAMPPSGRIPQSSINLIEQWIQEGLVE